MPPAGIMSRFLPELFLRGAETDISTVSRLQAEWKFLPPGFQDPGIQNPGFPDPCIQDPGIQDPPTLQLQLWSQTVSNDSGLKARLKA